MAWVSGHAYATAPAAGGVRGVRAKQRARANERMCERARTSACANERERAHTNERTRTSACATSPAAGGARGVSPRQPPSKAARFRRRRTLLRCARWASLLPPQNDRARFARSLSSPLPPQKDAPSLRSLRPRIANPLARRRPEPRRAQVRAQVPQNQRLPPHILDRRHRAQLRGLLRRRRCVQPHNKERDPPTNFRSQ
jgi:hypothetical protein